MTEPLELLVIEGQKNGARALISESEITSIGNDYDCDVMLGLPCIEHDLTADGAENQKKSPVDYPKLEMKQQEGRLLLRVVRGNIQIGQEMFDEGAQSELLPNTPVTLGKSVFVVGPATSPQRMNQGDQRDQADPAAQGDQSDLPKSQAISTDENPAELLESPESEVAIAKPKRRFNVMHAVAGLCVVVGGIVAFVNMSPSNTMGMADVSKSIQAELERGGFGALSVSLIDNDGVLVDGFLDSRAELYEVRSLLQSADAVIKWDVQAGETLVDSVESVFQVNGMVANVKSVARGSVLVETNTADLALLEQIETVAYTDVADLEKLELVNTVPIIEDPEAEDKGMEGIPGKRIVLIVAGEYIRTEDGAVYYTGSVLPSGHKVLAILDKKIQVELNDNETELTF